MSDNIEIFDLLSHPVCFTQPLRIVHSSGWVEHVPFGMLIIDILRPKVLVELGTHMGVSYCSFCQAVNQLELNTLCYAIDTWKGDSHAGYYEEDVLRDLKSHHDILYGNFSRLMETTFDDAVNYFADRSIDLLHIDGLHTHEAVKHDFETWIPKMSQQGVVLFHDINVHEREFGVWKFWSEVSQCYPHFEFNHGHGLGVLYVGKIAGHPLQSIFSLSADHANHFRNIFFVLGSRLSDKAAKESSVTSLSRQLFDKDQVIEVLSTQVNDHTTQTNELNRIVANLNDQIVQLTEEINDRDNRINDLNLVIFERDGQISNFQQALAERDGQISNFQQALAERDVRLDEISQEIIERDGKLSLREAQINQLHQLLSSHEQIVQQIYASTSWRLTYPLRALKALFADRSALT